MDGIREYQNKSYRRQPPSHGKEEARDVHIDRPRVAKYVRTKSKRVVVLFLGGISFLYFDSRVD
jgi:hypothetical protein